MRKKGSLNFNYCSHRFDLFPVNDIPYFLPVSHDVFMGEDKDTKGVYLICIGVLLYDSYTHKLLIIR